MNRNFRMRILKALVNVATRVMIKLFPEPKVSFPQTEIADRVWKQMFAVYKLEVAQGVFPGEKHR